MQIIRIRSYIFDSNRVDFYESCVNQLKKEIPKYLSKHSELEKSHRSFSKVLNGVASSEPNQKLQDLIFLFAQKQDSLEKEKRKFTSTVVNSNNYLDESQKLIIAPIRVFYIILSLLLHL